ncbi:class I SAM-dependent methyltransferase [Candidatus Woesearchaeota archaeon]|nr:class I SAM-dependent methyltransferase [Candidatus Woesearchaeota archaeon]
MTVDVWEAHWKGLEKPSFFSRFARFYRNFFRSRAVRTAFIKHFPSSGVFVEAGSGSSQTSVLIPRAGKKLIAVDYAETPLKTAKNFVDECIVADVRKLPFSDNSLEGVWNLGVMEHYTEDGQIELLREFSRVLKPGCRVVLFWPPPWGTDKVVLDIFSFVCSLFGSKKVFFPDEPGRVTKSQARFVLEKAGLKVVDVYHPLWDCFMELVVVGEKNA